MEHDSQVSRPTSVYREYAPRPELREYVRAVAWYGPSDVRSGPRQPVREFYVGGDVELMPTFADSQMSVLFDLGWRFAGNAWRLSPRVGASAMGAVTRATSVADVERSAMIGVYLRPRGCTLFGGASELTDQLIPLQDLWKGFEMAEPPTMEWVENLVARRLQAAKSSVRARQVADIGTYINRHSGRPSVTELASLSGLSRQHLVRLFREHLGVTPKLYSRLARFRGGLQLLRESERAGGWSRISAALGYADQSHFIAEFQEFTSRTPAQLARGAGFHPFIGDQNR